MELASVWPLVEGLKGINRFTNEVITLGTYQKGFMDIDEAKKLDASGDLQMMVGLDMQSLKMPGDNAHLKKMQKEEKKAPPKKKSTYKTKVVQAEG